MGFHCADLFEAVVDRVPERIALVCDDDRLSFLQLEQEANRVADFLRQRGLQAGDRVGIHGENSARWVIAMIAALKLRCVPININYRYESEELRYLLDNAGVVALFSQASFLPRVQAVRDRLPALRQLLRLDPGEAPAWADSSVDEALKRGAPERRFETRSEEDHFVVYTGGTTGMPRGVVWTHRDVIFALGGGTDPFSGEKIQQPEGFAARIRAQPVSQLPLCPLMHGAAQWSVLASFFVGNRIVLTGRALDPARAWRLMARESVNTLSLTGDAVAGPLLDALPELKDSLDLSALGILSSSGTVLSPVVKRGLCELLPELMVIDALGATEQGFVGMSLRMPGQDLGALDSGPLRVTPGPDVCVLDDTLQRVKAGSGVVGRLARSGHIPIGYHGDPEKTARVFLQAEGQRWSVPGDMARVESDGTITVLGRGSTCINTGGEKVYPEEVEAVLKAHDAVLDALLVGVPDARWGQRVTAVVSLRPEAALTLPDLDAHCRGQLAGYKVPRSLVLTAEIQRSPSGKPDYAWARALATRSLAPEHTAPAPRPSVR